MKRYSSLPVRALLPLLLLAAAILTQSCTHNNGDIGRWFGTWTVEQILVDGEPYSEYEHNMVWKFQNSVFSMQLINTNPDIHDRAQRWGSWRETDNELIVNFSHSDDTFPEGTGIYEPFAVSLFNPGGDTVLRIGKADGSVLTLTQTMASGENIVYTIKKQ